MGMDQFNSDDHYIYYCGQESLRRNEVTLTVNRSPKRSTWMQLQKWPNDLSSFPKQTIQPHCDPSLSPNHWCQRSWSWQVLWRCTTPSRTNTKNDVLLIIGDWNAKVESQKILGITGKFGIGVQNEAGPRLTEFCQENMLVIMNAFSNNPHMDIIRWSILKSDQFCYL